MAELEIADVHKAFGELRTELEAKFQDLDKVKRLEKVLDEYESNAEKARKESAAQIDELKAGQRALMERLGSAKGSDADPRSEETYKSFMGFAAGRIDKSEINKALLRAGESVSAGVLVPTVIERAILKNVTEISPVRSYARIVTTTATSVSVPRRLNLLQATYEGEEEDAQESVSQYGVETIQTHRLAVTVPVTNELLLGAFLDIEAELVADTAEAFARAEAFAFLHGNGTKRPLGIVFDDRVEVVPTAAAATLTMDDMIRASGQIKMGYDPWYYMNRRTLAYLRTQKGTDGQYLWSPAVSESTGPTFNGYPYDASFIDLDSYDAGSGGVPVIFGDLGMAYRIYDRTGMTFIRDDLTRKSKDIIEWTFRMYNDGRVVKPEAIKLIKLL